MARRHREQQLAAVTRFRLTAGRQRGRAPLPAVRTPVTEGFCGARVGRNEVVEDDLNSNAAAASPSQVPGNELAFLERDIGFEPTTFSLGKRKRPFRAVTGSDK